MSLSAFPMGFATGLGLIVAIGAQNAFVLRQGLRGEHVLAVCLACALSDSVLILIGVTAFGRISAVMPWLEPFMRWGGALFLAAYGARSLISALRAGAALVPDARPATPLWPTLATCLALTWLNPHVYLDTVVLLGTISTQFPGAERHFAAGAVTASFAFFFGLGYGARHLRRFLVRPGAWRVLDAVIGVTMWAIAFGLIRGA